MLAIWSNLHCCTALKKQPRTQTIKSGEGRLGVHFVTVCHRAFLRVMDGIIRRQRAKIRFFNNILTLMEKKKRFFSCFSAERRKKRLVFGGNTSETGTRIGDPEQTGAQWRYPRAVGQGTSHGRRTGAVWSTETSPAERNGQTFHLAERVEASGRWIISPRRKSHSSGWKKPKPP